MLTSAEFENNLKQLVHAKSPDTVPYFVKHDLQQRFGHWWNDAMPEVHCDFIERAYLQPQTAMTAKVVSGKIETVPQFYEMFSAVLVMTGLHYRTLSYHKENPRLRRAKSTEGGEQDSLPLFVALTDFHQFVSREPDPADTVARRQDLRAALQKARHLQRLQLAAYRRIKAFEFETGSSYAAFPHVARMAVTNLRGRIVNFHRKPWAEPTESTTRQVRRLYQEARQAIEQLGRE